MKRAVFLIIFFITIVYESRACDICGCGVGSYYIGILPDFKKRFIGIRYQYKTLRTHLGPAGTTSYLTTDETYQTAELWGGWNIGRRFRVLGFVPVNFNGRSNQGVSQHKNGLGDIAVVGYYQLLDKQQTVGRKLLVQSLWIGGGIKLPTGRYEPVEKKENEETPNSFQLGTGSMDFTLNAMYDVRLMDFGINANVSYKINTANKYDYQYGNKFTANVLGYYKIKVAQQLTVAPNVGLLYETAKKDTEDKRFTMDVSGGYALLATAGAEVSYKNIAIGGNFQPPVSQQLADMRVKSGNRAMVHVTYLF
ncbi:outer membrane putative beta-barrel porin/alpha-amylase [Chitinophaga niastensis]|uniref:Outer membrane putative beta-barrel porin/alpha-amylase n=1 Tax=Chitinophaga niastensis TaxID=536980 RepID=A0A2P8HHH4_CHINA|nr:transporter [Chitinophaga niastensis]PSL45629.1 outer membrane putative beta-barrel porin/alpha-amylase [Chitinophaga niastensis]